MSGSLTLETLSKLGKDAIRGFIKDLEETCAQNEEQIEIPIQHYFSKDVYAREIRIPQGALIVGKIHRHQNLNILSSGEVSVLTEDGMRRFKAPTTFVADPGAKRVIFAHADAVWTVVHGTAERNLEKIENEFIAKTVEDVVHLSTNEPTQIGEQLLIKGDQRCLG